MLSADTQVNLFCPVAQIESSGLVYIADAKSWFKQETWAIVDSDHIAEQIVRQTLVIVPKMQLCTLTVTVNPMLLQDKVDLVQLNPKTGCIEILELLAALQTFFEVYAQYSTHGVGHIGPQERKTRAQRNTWSQ